MTLLTDWAINLILSFERNHRNKEQGKPVCLSAQYPVCYIIAMVTMGNIPQLFFIESFMAKSE